MSTPEQIPETLKRTKRANRVHRLVLRIWHFIWIAYWSERLDDHVEFTHTSGIPHAQRRHAYHVWSWRDTFLHNPHTSGGKSASSPSLKR